MTNKDRIDKVWRLAKKIPGKDPNVWRQDPYGNHIQKSKFGSNSPTGWEIDHIKPQSKGGTDSLGNLQAMQTAKNRELGDSTKKRTRHNQ